MTDSKKRDESLEEVVLSAAWVGLFAQYLPVSNTDALDNQTAASLKKSVMQRIAPSPADSEQAKVASIRRDVDWVSLTKKLQVKLLHDDGTTISWLLRLLPGGRLQPHEHADGAEECMVLEGELSINGVLFKAGDYQIAYPGSVHYEVATETGAMLFLKSPASRKKDLMLA
jgi:quercetin dioxygenase-like cupin family protein